MDLALADGERGHWKVVGQHPFDAVTIGGREGSLEITDTLRSVTTRHDSSSWFVR
jgi:hypothetical protein